MGLELAVERESAKEVGAGDSGVSTGFRPGGALHQRNRDGVRLLVIPPPTCGWWRDDGRMQRTAAHSSNPAARPAEAAYISRSARTGTAASSSATTATNATRARMMRLVRLEPRVGKVFNRNPHIHSWKNAHAV
jgi:hypothetical protein